MRLNVRATAGSESAVYGINLASHGNSYAAGEEP